MPLSIRRQGDRDFRPAFNRLLLVGYFEGIDSERGIAGRPAESLALRSFLGPERSEVTPHHTTISRTRRLIDLETHRKFFGWVLQTEEVAKH